MKKSILILVIALIVMFSALQAEEEIIWKSRYNMIIDKNGDIGPGYIYNAIFTPDDKFIVVYNAIYTTTKVDPIISNDTIQI